MRKGGPLFKLAVRCILVLGAIMVVLAAAPQARSASLHVVAISLVDGKPKGSFLTLSGGRTPVLRLRQGEVVELRWSSDSSMALHPHGYDLDVQTTPDLDSVMSFTARFAGRFLVETHDAQGRDRVVLYIEVHPR